MLYTDKKPKKERDWDLFIVHVFLCDVRISFSPFCSLTTTELAAESGVVLNAHF